MPVFPAFLRLDSIADDLPHLATRVPIPSPEDAVE
jgi:hypothetical protein